MRLSLIFELLLIFVLLAFAASKSIKKQKNSNKGIRNGNDDKQEDSNNNINKYCKCSEAYCNCCRDFQMPLFNLNGPGCASLMYLSGDKMSVSLSVGKRVISNRTLSSRKPTPVCMPLPGGISKFCGRVYNIARAGEEFRACLGLELQAKSTVEAAVRVSCFKFGPRGVTSEAADPLPLVPQDEKVDDDDDDDDEDDDDDAFDLVGDDDDDDDDDDDGDAANDVESADYTGFSLLGDDLLGDLFGSSGGKKSNKNKNKKKQAPTSTTTTTSTTKRPRPSRRPTRRPNRTTTPRPTSTRTTTVKVRPVNRKPTRKPPLRRTVRPRPSRRPPTSTTLEVAAIPEVSSTISSTVMTPTVKIIPVIQTTESISIVSTEKEQALEPVSIVTQNPTTVADTSAKDETQFEDPGLEMSLAQLTGQLSVMPVTPILPTSVSMMTTNREQTNYEKIETITPKTSSTTALPSSSEAVINDDLVQIVQNLDSHSEESIKEISGESTDESRSHNSDVVPNDYYGGLKLTKKKKGNDFDYEDLDVIGLTEIGTTVGDELGLFGRNKKHKNNKDNKNIKNGKKGNNDYDILGSLSDTLGLSDNDNQKKKKHRGRQNKMMRGDWDLV